MPLSNLVFTPGQVPDYASMGFKAASLAPDLQAKFIAGQKAAQDQQMAQLKYQQEKQKADLFSAIAPELKRYQLAELQMKMQQLNGMAVPGGYNPGLPGTRTMLANRTTATGNPTNTDTAPTGQPIQPGTQATPAYLPPLEGGVPTNDFGQPFQLNQQNPMYFPGLVAPETGNVNTVDMGDYSGDASGYGDMGDMYS